MKTALLLIDIQNDYFPGGKMELEGSPEASVRAKQLLGFFRQGHLPVVHIQHVSTRPGATFFLPDTDGVRIQQNVRPLETDVVFQKHYPNSFRETPLLKHLRDEGIARLVICGMMTHMCVDATTRAAADYGFECVIVQDACATRQLTHRGQSVPAALVHASFLAALDAAYGKVLTAEEIISHLRS